MLTAAARRSTSVLSAGLPALALLAGAASASAPSRWIDYFPSRVGRTCASQFTVHEDTFTAVDTVTRRLASRTTSHGVTTIVEQDVTTEATTPPPRTPQPPQTQTLRDTFGADGSLATVQGVTSSPSVRYTFSGEERYPSVTSLRAGRTRAGTLGLTITPLMGGAASAFAPYLLPGHHALEVRFGYVAGPAPRLSAIRTPAGTFGDLLGAQLRITSARATDVTAAGKVALRRDLDQLAEFFSSTSYFAPGTGIVSTTILGHLELLDRCSG
jgi:hypothetical protein